MRHRFVLALGALALLAQPASASAQSRPNTREGFFISFGVAGGSAKLDCNLCSGNRETGSAGYLRMGGTVSPRILVGGDAGGWLKTINGVDVQTGYLVASVYFYPRASGAWYLQGGAGVTEVSLSGSGSSDVTGTGFGLVVGTGYDWRVARNFSLTPYVSAMLSSSLDLSVNGTKVGSTTPSLVQFGLGFSWH
jgi:hypothetical protein